MKMYSAELWNRGSFDRRFITPKGLVKDIPCLDHNYLWASREEAEKAIMEESKNWYSPWDVQGGINEHDIKGEDWEDTGTISITENRVTVF